MAGTAALALLLQKTETSVNDELAQLPLSHMVTSTDCSSTEILLQTGFSQSLQVLPKNFEEQNPTGSSLQLGRPAQLLESP